MVLQLIAAMGNWIFSRKKKIKPFLLNRLPIIVRIQVVRSMDHKDCIKLAMTSRKTEELVKVARIKTSYMRVDISPTAHLSIPDWKLKMVYDKQGEQIRGATVMRSDEMKPWLNEQSDSLVENAVKLYKKVDNLFLFGSKFELAFKKGYEKRATVNEVLSNPSLKNWEFCYFYEDKIDPNDLKMILNMATPARGFTSYAKEIPVDFRHENAFKFHTNDYHDAGWVQIEDLYGLRNCRNVTLGKTSFTHEQIKAFINFWVNSDVDMFWWMSITTSEALDFNDLLDGILVLRFRQMFLAFTLSKSSSNRKENRMFCINYGASSKSLVLSAWRSNEKFVAARDQRINKKFKNCHKILKLLSKKKGLEEQFEQAEDGDKPGLQREIDDVVDELSNLHVFFEDGKAVLA